MPLEFQFPTPSPSQDRVLRLWGKTDRSSDDANDFHPALYHMFDVGMVARALLSMRSSPRWKNYLARNLGANEDVLIHWLPWLVALHDIGKISAPFQEQSQSQRERLLEEGFSFGNRTWDNNPQHPWIGQLFIVGLDLPYHICEVLKDSVAGHHGYFAPAGSQRQTRGMLRHEPEEWKVLRHGACEILRQRLASTDQIPWGEPANLSAAVMSLTGFIILCDWLGSDGSVFSICPRNGLEEYLPISEERAKIAVENAGFFGPVSSSAPITFSGLFPKFTPPRPLQSAIDEIPGELFNQPCLIVIEAPTGEGKTEAAMALARRIGMANGTDEFYYALPTTATSNQMFGRIQGYLYENLDFPTRTKLVHGQAFLFEDDLLLRPLGEDNQQTTQASLEWFSPKKRALLAPFGVGTVDQIELAALNVRHNALRMAGLSGKVVVIDEVHAYDVYMTTILRRLLEWLSALGTSVILLSATLPKDRRSELVQAYAGSGVELGHTDNPYPCIIVNGMKGSYRLTPPAYQMNRKIGIDHIHFGEQDVESKAAWLLEAVEQGGCACWITNTVDKAQRLFQKINDLAEIEVDRMLLHARFPLEDRQRLEKQLSRKYGPDKLNRPGKGIVIGTQVLEQSLDLDFDVMVSDLAPVDLLLQRAGRLHRHGKTQRPSLHRQPVLWINTERAVDGILLLGVDQYVYAEYILRKSWEVLLGLREIELPGDYRELIEAVYNRETPIPGGRLFEAWNELQIKESQAAGKAEMRLLPHPDPVDSFCGPAAGIRFEESEHESGWFIAQTRLGEESLTVVPLERYGSTACFFKDGQKVILSANQVPSRRMQFDLLRRSVHISHPKIVQYLRETAGEREKLFTDSELLRDCYPLWMTYNQTTIRTDSSSFLIRLDPLLGVLIKKEDG
jgi:CRISPR-associated endonuclease/helicase Cas3